MINWVESCKIGPWSSRGAFQLEDIWDFWWLVGLSFGWAVSRPVLWRCSFLTVELGSDMAGTCRYLMNLSFLLQHLYFSELWTCRVHGRRVKRSKCCYVISPHCLFLRCFGTSTKQNGLNQEVNTWGLLCGFLQGNLVLWVRSGMKELED